MKNERSDFLKRDFVQGFPAYCGFMVDYIDHGIMHSRIKIRPELKQQDGFVHAGVLATLADHTAGYSAYTIVPETMRILTIEFKINYFKPAIGEEIICKSKVINQGKNIIIAESELYDLVDNKERFISKALITLTAMPSRDIL
ncbi:MAG: PaaI family thioesterase [Promethearchaeota archaeon]